MDDHGLISPSDDLIFHPHLIQASSLLLAASFLSTSFTSNEQFTILTFERIRTLYPTASRSRISRLTSLPTDQASPIIANNMNSDVGSCQVLGRGVFVGLPEKTSGPRSTGMDSGSSSPRSERSTGLLSSASYRSAASTVSTSGTSVTDDPGPLLQPGDPPCTFNDNSRKVGIIASPAQSIQLGTVRYSAGEIRTMGDTLSQARITGEMPKTTSSPLDAEVIVHDYNLLTNLRHARGDPALPPPQQYTTLRVEAARLIRERDSLLRDAERARAASDRVDSYLRIVGQEARYYELAGQVAGQRGIERPCQADMEGIGEEIMGVIESSVLDATGPIRVNAKRVAVAADTLDTTASTLDGTAATLDTTANTLGSTSATLNNAAASLNVTSSTLNSAATSLEGSVSVIASQIGTLNAQLHVLTDLIQSQRTSPSSSPTTPYPPSSIGRSSSIDTDIPAAISRAVEERVREQVTMALRDILGAQEGGVRSDLDTESVPGRYSSSRRTSSSSAVAGRRHSEGWGREARQARPKSIRRYLRGIFRRR